MNASLKNTLVVAILGVAGLGYANAGEAATLPPAQCQTLLAGKSITAGQVCVTNDDTYLYVTYETTGDWYLDDLHLFANTSYSLMPVTKTLNPKIGNFPFVIEDLDAQAYTFSLPLGDVGVQNPCDASTVSVAAHAALVRHDAIGTVLQSETGWANGSQIAPKGSWAMFFTYVTQCPVVPQEEVSLRCETAFAFGDQTFAELGTIKNARWGWQLTVNANSQGSTPIYAGAAQNDITKGTYVGQLDYTFYGGSLTVNFDMVPGWVMKKTHVYADQVDVATSAPGQYGNQHELDNGQFDSYALYVEGDPIFVVAHAEACTAN